MPIRPHHGFLLQEERAHDRLFTVAHPAGRQQRGGLSATILSGRPAMPAHVGITGFNSVAGAAASGLEAPFRDIDAVIGVEQAHLVGELVAELLALLIAQHVLGVDASLDCRALVGAEGR